MTYTDADFALPEPTMGLGAMAKHAKEGACARDLSKRTRGAILALGLETCLMAYCDHEIGGNGASTVRFNLGLESLALANCAIDAGREWAKAIGCDSAQALLERIGPLVRWEVR